MNNDMTITSLGASGLHEKTNVPWAQCKDAPVGEQEASDWGRSIIMNCLGVIARPAPADESGAAQGIIAEVAGTNGVCIGGYDSRSAKMAGEISPGETAIGATGKDFDARALFKDQRLALLVGDDHVVMIDRKKELIDIRCPGGVIRVSKKGGVNLMSKGGKSSIQLKGSFAALLGEVVLGGRRPFSKVADATKVDAEIRKLWGAMAASATSAALQTAATTAQAAFLGTKSGVSLGK